MTAKTHASVPINNCEVAEPWGGTVMNDPLSLLLAEFKDEGMSGTMLMSG